MPTAASWTERSRVREEVRAARDVVHLLRLRAGSRRRVRTAVLLATFLVLTAAAVVVPLLLPGAGTSDDSLDALTLLPTAYAGFLLLAVISGVASGGGRELVPRDELVAFPVSPTTDHLGALLLAPLNVAWLLQGWALLGVAAYGVGRGLGLVGALLGVVLWVLAATALGQAVAWAVEVVRRGRHGVLVVRAALAALLVGIALLQLLHRLGPVLDRLPTRWLVIGSLRGFDAHWWVTMGVQVLLLVTAVVVGAVPAHLAARRIPRDELRAESGSHPARRTPSSDLAMLLRIDRASVWRAVPMRRGLMVLAIAPGLVSLAGGLDWGQLLLLPGLVASGGALLFGVNAWCLDGRGGLWRESLPVSPRVVFAARAVVLTEFLLVASAVTLGLGALRAGVPTAAELSATVSVWLVATLQVVGGAMRWSQRRPYAADLRSARATPAPPLAMLGYSTRLALLTTITSMVFQLLAGSASWPVPMVVAIGLGCWSGLRLLRARDSWADPVVRARVVTTVAL